MSVKPLVQIQHEGWNALVEKLGPIDASRFLQIYDPGSGDYTEERHTWLSNDPDEIIASIMKRRKESE